MDQHKSFINDLFGVESEDEGEGEVAQYNRAIENTLISAMVATLVPPTVQSPLLPEMPRHAVCSSQHQNGDHFGSSQGALVPVSESSMSYNTSGWCEDASFTRWPKEDAALVHSIDATENLQGVQTVLALKSSRASFLEEAGIFMDFNPTVAKLMASRPSGRRSTFAFLQTTTRGHGFKKHDNALANSTIAMTGKSYLALLRFFDKEWSRVCSKMKSELKIMQQSSCGMNICKGLSFYGNGVSRYQTMLESFGDFALFLIASVDSTMAARGGHGGDKVFVQVKYKKNPNSSMQEDEVKSLGCVEVPVDALVFLAGCRGQVEFALNNLVDEGREEQHQDSTSEAFAVPFLPPTNFAGSNSGNNSDYAHLASQIRHPVPQAELKIQSAADKILEYACGSVAPINQLSADDVRMAKTGGEQKLAPPFCKQVTQKQQPRSGRLLMKTPTSESVLTSFGAARPTLEELLNRGISEVSAERRQQVEEACLHAGGVRGGGYFTAEHKALNCTGKTKGKGGSTGARSNKRSSSNSENRDPKNLKKH
jgi:hypothetical protein